MPIRNKQISTASSGTVTCTDTQDDQLLVLDTGLIASITISFPATPVDGQRVSVKARSGITALTMTTPVGSIQTPLGSLSAGATYSWTWDQITSKWY